MAFFEILSKLMNDNHIKSKQLSETLNIGKNQIKYWKDKGNIPNGETLILLAKYFNCSVDYLVGLSDNPKSSIEIINKVEQCDKDEQRKKLLNNYDKMNDRGHKELVRASELIIKDPDNLKEDSENNKIVS